MLLICAFYYTILIFYSQRILLNTLQVITIVRLTRQMVQQKDVEDTITGICDQQRRTLKLEIQLTFLECLKGKEGL